MRPLAGPGERGLGRTTPLLAWDLYAFMKSRRMHVRRGRRLGRSDEVVAPRYDPGFARRYVLDELLPFWADHALDRRHGGFTTCLDRSGRVYDPTKQGAMNARTVYAFTLGHELNPSRGYLEVARRGARFMSYGFWDRSFGGWYERVDPDGYPRVADKTAFSHAYSIFGLARYAHVAGDEPLLSHVIEGYEFIEAHGWDHSYGGYFERCRRDWRVSNDSKTICVQLDFLKAALALYDVTGEARFLARAGQLADLVVERMRDSRRGAVLERFRRDWRYDPLSTRDVLEIGHCLKAARLLVKAHHHLGRPSYLAAAERVLDFAIRYGWDRRYGGFYHYVFRSGRPASLEKLWWSQCEGISALLVMHAVGGDPAHLRLARRLTDFCFEHFADPVFGEWYYSCAADGTPVDTRKGAMNKAAYHTVDACFDIVAHEASENPRAPDLGVPAAGPR